MVAAPVDDGAVVERTGDDLGDDEPDTRSGVVGGFTPPAGPAARRRIPSGAVAVVDSLHPTQQLSGRGLPSGESDTRQASTASPLEALRSEEIARTRVFLRMCVVIAAATLGVLALSGGDRAAKLAVVIGCGIVFAAATWLLVVTRDPRGYTTRRVTIAATLIGLGAFGGVYYWGVVSPINALILYGIYFFSYGASLSLTVYVYALCATVHAALAMLIGAGVIPDRGIVSVMALPVRDQILSQMVVQFLYLCAYVTARASRQTTIEAVAGLEQAVRAVAQREALLSEARQELERALKVGGPGRYTDQVVGSFRLGALIGRGGMGEVYQAENVHDGSEAAVKLLHPGGLAHPQHVSRFLREAEAAAKLSSPHVVTVLEVGTTAGEIPFIAMERLRGFDLAHHLRRHRRLGVPNAVGLVEQIGAGLHAAKIAGIVHRDIKPHNLFLAERHGTLSWKILDFGVSKLVGSGGTLTRGHVVGTPSYMAPEQARGEDVDHRADLYALSAIAYRCLTGHPPFTGKDVPSTLFEVVHKVPTQPSLLAELDPDLDRVLAIGLAKDPAARFQRADELSAAMAAAARGALPEALRRRADALIEAYPWGRRGDASGPTASADRPRP